MTYRLLPILCLILFSQAQAETPAVVVTIRPIHSLVAGVMKGVAMPKLLMSTHEDAHHFSLTPSTAKTLGNADLVVWVGPQMELALDKAIKTLAVKAKILTLLNLPGLTKFDIAPGVTDPHIWLDPDNAKVIVKQVAKVLSGLDPEHAGIYSDNANNMLTELDSLIAKLRQELEPVKHMQYFVYHDAYQYFEKAFDLSRSIPVVKDTEGTLRATQRELLEKEAEDNNIHCLFGEPYHGENVVESLAEQLNLHVSYLDPMGLEDKSSPEGSYMTMMEDIASTLKACLTRGNKE